MTNRAAQLGELSTTAGYPWKLSMSAYLQNFATKNAVFTNLRNKNAVFTHFRDKYAVFTHFCVKNLWFHRYVTICLTRASTYTFRSCFVIILSPQVLWFHRFTMCQGTSKFLKVHLIEDLFYRSMKISSIGRKFILSI